MSTLPDNKTTLVIAITVFVIAILFSIFLPKKGIYKTTDTQNKGAVHESTLRNLSEEQVISLANQEAIKKGYDLSKYETPKAKYETLRKDKRWTVFYEGKKKLLGNHFLVWVNDQTSESKLMPGE